MPPSLLFTILQGQKGLRWLRCESLQERMELGFRDFQEPLITGSWSKFRILSG